MQLNGMRVLKWSLALLMMFSTALAFDVDLSRRRRDLTRGEAQSPAVQGQSKSASQLFESLFSSSDSQELVILHTATGFVPRSVSLRVDGKYRIYVVNVNERDKNVSFTLDAFSENHSIYYGKVRSFEVTPKKEGIYTYNCPETAAEGKFVVVNPNARGLATEAAPRR